MHILPTNTVEHASVARITHNANHGIVPPWLTSTLPVRNTGIVPPYLLDGTKAVKTAAGNTGIVPPWMLTGTASAADGSNDIGIVPPWLEHAAI